MMLQTRNEFLCVKDQCHGPVTENGRAGNPLDVMVKLAEIFYDRLMAADDGVHRESDALIVHAGNDDLLDSRRFPADLELFPQTQIGHDVASSSMLLHKLFHHLQAAMGRQQ